MKISVKIILFFALIMGLFSCAPQSNLSKDELKMIKEIAFDIETVKQVKRYSKEPIYQFETSNPGYIIENGKPQKTGIKKQNGISFQVANQRTDNIIFTLKNDLKNKGYLIFVSEQGYEKAPSEITMIKSRDPFDILRLQNTDGANYDIDNQAVIQKLETWHKKFGIEIIGADYDWVEILILNKPQNIKEFAEEVYEFCPDSVDQGVETMEALASEISNKSRLFLWWD